MKKALNFVFFLLFLSQIIYAQERVRVVLDSIYSYSVGGYKKFNVILPKDYGKTEERYKVIFLLHGYGSDHNDWINRTNLVKYLDDYSYVVVTPQADNSWYTNALFIEIMKITL